MSINSQFLKVVCTMGEVSRVWARLSHGIPHPQLALGTDWPGQGAQWLLVVQH